MQPLRSKRIGDHTLGAIARFLVVVGVFLYILSVLSIGSSRADVPSVGLFLGPAGETPVLYLRPPAGGAGGPGGGAGEGGEGGGDGEAAPLGTVVVVHGFAASKEFMRELGYSLARGGFEVYLVDLPGHAHSRVPLDPAGLIDWFRALLRDLQHGGRLAGDRLFLVGHSLGTIVVTRGALASPELPISAVVALSPILAEVTLTEPPNYLALHGEGEIPGVREAALGILRSGTGLEAPELGRVYGDFADGTARSAGPVGGTTHVSVANNVETVKRVLRWLYAAAGTPERGLPRLEREGAERNFGLLGAVVLWLGVFYLAGAAAGLIGHAPRRPDARAVVEDARKAAGRPAEAPPPSRYGDPPALTEEERRAKDKATQLFAGTRVIPLLFAVAVVPSTLIPGYFGWFTFPRQHLVDYLALYLLIFTLTLAPFLASLGRLLRVGPLVAPSSRGGPVRSALLGLFLFVLAAGLVGWFATLSTTNLIPPQARWGQIGVLALLFLPFAAVDEMIRGTVHDRTGLTWGLFVTVIGKLIIGVSWYAALLLPRSPQGLVVMIPLLIQLLVLLDLAGTAIYNEHGNWVAAAVFKALSLAWILGTVFPLVAGVVGLH